MNEKIRVVYIEDHKVVKEGVNFLLSQYPNIEIIDHDLNVDELESFVHKHQVDLFIIDLQLHVSKESKQRSGFEICNLIKTKFPHIKIIAHSMFDNVEAVNDIFKKGANGFVSKKSGHAELLNAINHVMKGERYLCQEIIRKTKNSLQFINGEDDTLKATNDPFTKAEKTILEKIAKGYSTKEIAQQLSISEKTVETHRKHLFEKAKVKNAAELIAFTYSRRLLMD